MSESDPITRSDRVKHALLGLGGTPDEQTLEGCVNDVTGWMYTVATRKFTRGTDIVQDDNGALRVNRRHKTVGPVKELRDLAAACRRAMRWPHNARPELETLAWCKAWSKIPDRTSRALWKPKFRERIVRSTIARGGFVRVRFPVRREMLGYEAGEYRAIVPKPEVVRMAIEAMLRRLETKPNAKARNIDGDAAAAKAAIRSAYQKLTGRSGGRVIGPDGKPSGRLHRLGRDIDAIFGTSLYATRSERAAREKA